MAQASIAPAATLARAPRTVRWLRLGLQAVLVALVALVLFALLIGRLIPMTGRQAIVIGGGSMEPSIPLGSVAITEPVPAGLVAIGDVVSIRAGNGTVVTHRVARVVERAGGTWLELKGDANAEPDPVLVDSAAMLGRVTATIPYAGFLLRFLSIPAALITVLGLGATLIVGLYLLDDLAAPRRRPAHARLSAAVTTLPDGRTLAPSVAYRKRPRHEPRAPRAARGRAALPTDRAATGTLEDDLTAPARSAGHHDLHRGHRRRGPRRA